MRARRSRADNLTMDLKNIYAVVSHDGPTLRVTRFTRTPFWGDPSHHCEEISPREISRLCRENPRLRISD